MLTYQDNLALREQLVSLRCQHRELDAVIQQLIDEGTTNQITLTRLKRKKLQLKDTIAKLNSQLIPNLNA